MKPSLRHAAVSLLLLCGLALPATAQATETTSTPAVTPPVVTTPAAPPPVTPPPVVPPAKGKLKLELQKVTGEPLFAVMGTHVILRGIVRPFVAGQKVKVTLLRSGHAAEVRELSVLPWRKGAGQFRLSFTFGDAELVQATVVHEATLQQARFTASSGRFRFVWPHLGPGSQGQSVRVLQAELWFMGYAIPVSGYFDQATAQALVAFRKLTGLPRVGLGGYDVWSRIAHGGGHFQVRYRGDGRHVEANLTRQVLAEIEPGGRVRAIYTMSSGKPSTPTVIGRFQVYRKEPGTNSHGMVDSSYFIGGYAIHGYESVPTYAASHGCLRVPIPDASSIYGWISFGTGVDVYNENGRGSRVVSPQAGP